MLSSSISSSLSDDALCPCGSGKTYAQCCGPIIGGQSLAVEAEQLMRSRYTAYVTHNADYLIDSWHPDCQMQSQRAAIEESFSETKDEMKMRALSNSLPDTLLKPSNKIIRFMNVRALFV